MYVGIDEGVDLLAVRCLDIDGSFAVGAILPRLVFARIG